MATLKELYTTLKSLRDMNHISNDTKADDLNRISKFFNLDLKVVEGKPNT